MASLQEMKEKYLGAKPQPRVPSKFEQAMKDDKSKTHIVVKQHLRQRKSGKK